MPYKDPAKQLEAGRRFYHRNKADRRNRNRVQAARTKSAIAAVKAAACCGICGESDARCLDFHHVGAKSFEINQAYRLGVGLERLIAEMSECVLICANCHRKEHAREDSNLQPAA